MRAAIIFGSSRLRGYVLISLSLEFMHWIRDQRDGNESTNIYAVLMFSFEVSLPG